MQKNKIRKEIISFIEDELKHISHLAEELSECRGRGHFICRAKGSILHDFYNVCERIFEHIAHQINGGYQSGREWHKRLLHRMTIGIKGIRPPVISKEMAAELDEYLAFRHLFRNIYGFELESGRLGRLAEKFKKTAIAFQQEIRNFIKKL